MVQIDLTRYKRLGFLLLATLVLFVLAFAFYDIIRVEPLRLPQNIQAFPKIQPRDLPDAAIALSECTKELRMCTSDSECEECGAGKFGCTVVQRDGQFEINGIKVPKGNFCLPKKDPKQGCNMYTGKYVWTTAADCPPNEKGEYSSQCWKCTCLYPDLFYDEKDCSTQIACVNTSANTAQSAAQQRTKNRLIGTPYSKYAGQVWDPNAPTQAGDSVLNQNPYATDDQGRPLFYCDCDARDNNGQKEFLRLPNDPYSCHVDQCYAYGQKITTTYGCKTPNGQDCDPYATPENCTCKCNCSLSQAITRADGTCQVVAGMCYPGRIKDDYSGCDCGVMKKIRCRSKLKNQTEMSLPVCKMDDNPWGEECQDQCTPNPCNFGGTCIYNADGSSSCNCDRATNKPQNLIDANGAPANLKSTADCSKWFAAPGTVMRYIERGAAGAYCGDKTQPREASAGLVCEFENTQYGGCYAQAQDLQHYWHNGWLSAYKRPIEFKCAKTPGHLKCRGVNPQDCDGDYCLKLGQSTSCRNDQRTVGMGNVGDMWRYIAMLP